MTNTYYLDSNNYDLDSNNYDSLLLKLIETIQRTADQHTLSIFLLGATARDIVMTTFHGAAQQRATLDVDFGICVSDWKAF
jgi:predicted nucleotidyltransferase